MKNSIEPGSNYLPLPPRDIDRLGVREEHSLLLLLDQVRLLPDMECAERLDREPLKESGRCPIRRVPLPIRTLRLGVRSKVFERITERLNPDRRAARMSFRSDPVIPARMEVRPA